jgi:hypothetical protein
MLSRAAGAVCPPGACDFTLDNMCDNQCSRAGWGVLRRERREKRQPLDGGPGGRAPLVGFQGQGPRVKVYAGWLQNSL